MGGALPPGSHDGHARFLQTRTFGSLDGLRAIAILVVVWHHTTAGEPRWAAAGRGFLGVDLFFVISGFLIVTLLLRERRRTGGISLKDFYVRRFLRIFPPYYLMLAIVGATAFLSPGSRSAAVRDELPWALLYVSNLVPMQSMLAITWSLSVEEQFYLVVPALERFVRRALPILLPAAYVLAALPPFGVFPDAPLPAFFRETTFGPILLGVMLAHVLDDPRGFAWVSGAVGWRLAPAFAAGLVLLAASHPAPDISGWPRLLIHWAILTLVASCVVRERHALSRVLALWPMRRIGAVSYGIYLFHLIVMHFVTKALRAAGASSDAVAFAANALASWGVAELSYRQFEARFLALKSRFGGATSRPAPTAAAGAKDAA